MKIKKNKGRLNDLLFLLVIALVSWNTASAESVNTSPTINEKSPAIVGHGTIKAIDLEKRQLTITHDAIKAIDWPAMTMAFTTTEKLDISQLKAGEVINFQLEKNKANQMIIIHIEKADNQKG